MKINFQENLAARKKLEKFLFWPKYFHCVLLLRYGESKNNAKRKVVEKSFLTLVDVIASPYMLELKLPVFEGNGHDFPYYISNPDLF